jgi:hypothetical protein
MNELILSRYVVLRSDTITLPELILSRYLVFRSEKLTDARAHPQQVYGVQE